MRLAATPRWAKAIAITWGGGFVQVVGNVVSVLTEGAIPASVASIRGVAAENLRAAHQKRADNEVAFDEPRAARASKPALNCGWLAALKQGARCRIGLCAGP